VLLATNEMVWVCSSGRGVAIDDGDHPGGGVLDWNFYSGSHRLVYHRGMTTEKLFTFQTITSILEFMSSLKSRGGMI